MSERPKKRDEWVTDTPRVSEDTRTYYPPVETHLLESRHVPQTFKIEVMQPARRRGDSTRYPVIYATDGNMAFDVLKGISQSMQMSAQDSPPFILVGISYPAESPFAGLLLRARDLTFPNYPRLGTRPPPIEGVLQAQGTKDFYGAEEFRAFIERELVPFIDTTYASVPGDRTYFGHSAGGGFGLFTLFTRPELFKRYIVSSPGLIYHGVSPAGIRYEEYDFLLRYARDFMSTGRQLDATKLYMSVGTEEEFEPGLEQWRIASSFRRMVALLNAQPIAGLELTAEELSGETHGSVWPIAFMHGVRAVFGTRVRRT